jgi:hypothetical protein
MIEYKLVPFHEIAEIVAKNADSHARETLENRDYPLQMDWKYYLEASHTGQCVAVIAKKPEIIGYSVFTVSNDPHSRSVINAVNDFFYILPEHRGEKVDLIGAADKFLREIGVNVISYILSSPVLGRMVRKSGYGETHKVWSKSL